MKSKKEIEKMIQVCKDLKDVMPEHNFFGGNNWEKLDQSIRALTQAIGLDKGEISDKTGDIIELIGDDAACDNPAINAFDWVVGNTDDAPATQEDIDTFKKKTTFNPKASEKIVKASDKILKFTKIKKGKKK